MIFSQNAARKIRCWTLFYFPVTESELNQARNSAGRRLVPQRIEERHGETEWFVREDYQSDLLQRFMLV